MTLQVLAHLGPTGIFFKSGKLCQELQEQHTSLTNARGTTALSTFRLAKVASCVLTPANLEWVGDLSSTSRLILGSRARQTMKDLGGVRGLPRHLARGNPIGLQETSRLKVECVRECAFGYAKAIWLDKYVKNDRQVLSFECYYKEMVEGSQEESERHRRSLINLIEM